jgi:phosphoribosylformylglycinamidine (FGAM) synthase-like enzyme
MGSILSVQQKKFAEEVDKIIKKGKSNHIEAIIEICEKYGIDPSSVGKIIPKAMKERIRAEGQEMNLLPKDKKEKKLPFKS